MAKQDKYIAVLVDKENQTWIYEGSVQGIPIWTAESESKPKLMSETDAYEIAHESKQFGDTAFVKRA